MPGTRVNGRGVLGGRARRRGAPASRPGGRFRASLLARPAALARGGGVTRGLGDVTRGLRSVRRRIVAVWRVVWRSWQKLFDERGAAAGRIPAVCEWNNTRTCTNRSRPPGLITRSGISGTDGKEAENGAGRIRRRSSLRYRPVHRPMYSEVASSARRSAAPIFFALEQSNATRVPHGGTKASMSCRA